MVILPFIHVVFLGNRLENCFALETSLTLPTVLGLRAINLRQNEHTSSPS